MKKLNANFLLLMLLVLATSCSYAQEITVIDKTYPVQPFSSIDYDAVGKVIFTQSEKTSVRVEGDKKLIDKLEVNVSKEVLKIEQKGKFSSRSKKNLTIYISSPTIEAIDAEGVGNWVLKGKVKTPNLKIDFEGVGNFEALDLDIPSIIANYEGVGNLKLGGTSNFIEIKSEGVGSIDTQKLIAKSVVLRASGVGSVKVYASESIDLNNEGVGSVTYYGNPAVKNIKNSGVGKTKQGQ
ncbi:MAG TPA: head GIN domain-containing protein [Dysgonamonadaceae bacterium]|jgi:hypothetical protein|nr:head GIN domain-containing protein [Dysgonamonadaceae bacterium]